MWHSFTPIHHAIVIMSLCISLVNQPYFVGNTSGNTCITLPVARNDVKNVTAKTYAICESKQVQYDRLHRVSPTNTAGSSIAAFSADFGLPHEDMGLDSGQVFPDRIFPASACACEKSVWLGETIYLCMYI